MEADGAHGSLDALETRIRAAEKEATGIDLHALAARAGDASVDDLAPPKARADRKLYLERQLGSEAEAELAFERVINGNELQPVRYLECGAHAARSICRITMRDAMGRGRGFGTGFLIADQVLITNNHVLPHPEWAALSFAEFDYAFDRNGDPLPAHLFQLRPERLFQTSKQLDFTVVAIEPASRGGSIELNEFGCLPLIPQVGKVLEGEWLTIIQHPAGDRKAVCVRENRFLQRTDDVLWYSTDTLGGSSGSPVFNNDWQVVALHHAGVPKRDDSGRILRIDGQPYVHGVDSEDRIQWVANAGIRVSRIVQTLKELAPDHPMLAPVLTARVSPAAAVLPMAPPRTTPASAAGPAPAPAEEADGAPAAAMPAALPAVPQSSVPAPPEIGDASGYADFDAPLSADYTTRPGYDPAFLGDGLIVPMPTLSRALKKEAARLTMAPGGIELKYLGYSVVQHARRRLPILSVANIDFAGRFAMRRPRDRWMIDPRIAVDQQLGEFYYAANQFDRGHLTRREDMEYGATRLQALERAADTMHFTNCAPQHARFNQSRDTWQGIERHLLEDSIMRNDFRATVMTGPVLAADDPAWDRFPDIRYPRRFWKIAVARTVDGRPFAAAFLLDQSEAIARFGIEAAELPFGEFHTFQVPVKEIERLSGLRFVALAAGRRRSLSVFDPLAGKGAVAAARADLLGRESSAAAGMDAPSGYVPLWSVRAITRRP